MTSRLSVGLWALAAGLAAGSLALVLGSDHEPDPYVVAALTSAVGLALVGAGLVARSRAPANRTGTLMTVTGFVWFVGALGASNDSTLFTIGAALGSVPLAFFAWMVMAFPSGRLETTRNRGIVAAAFAIAGGLVPLHLLFARSDHFGCTECPPNAMLVWDSPAAADAVWLAVQVSGIALLAVIGAILVQRLRVASTALRRAIAPVFVTSGIAIVLVGAHLVAVSVSERLAGPLAWLMLAALLAVPLAFLYGLLRSALARTGVARVLLLELPEQPTLGEAERALQRTLRDPSLRLAYWLPERKGYIDVGGRPFALPEDGPAVVTRIDYENRPVAALVHDRALLAEPELLEEVCAVIRIGLEKDRGMRDLRASEARLRALVEAIPDLMFRIRRDGVYLDYKVESDEQLYDPEVIGKTVHERLPADAADGIMAAVERALDEGGVQTIEHRLDFHGEERWFEGRVVASGADEVVLTIRDFTQRRQREEELQRSEARNRALVNALPDLMFRVSRDGVYLDFKSDDPTKLYVPPSEIVGATVYDLLPADVADRIMAAGRKALDEWSVEHLDYQLVIRGEPRDFEARIVRVDSDEFLMIVRDFTERRRAEAEIQASRARIVHAGDEARRRLERNLHDGAQQRLVAVSIAMRLAKSKIAEEPEAAAQLLTGASEELSRALEELRELARGIHPAILTDRGLGAALEALAGRSPVPVDLQPPSDRLPGPVEAAVYYVVSEALANVAKYAEASRVRISVARANGVVSVEVADDGVGGADPGRGTGLRGLADRVEALGGKLQVGSNNGSGTSVRADIPVA